MLHPFDVVLDHSIVDAEEFQKVRQKVVAPGDIAREGLTGGRENEAAIFFVLKQALAVEALDHVGDAGLRNTKARGDIDHARIALGIDQFQDAFEVILDRGRVARGNGLGRHEA